MVIVTSLWQRAVAHTQRTLLVLFAGCLLVFLATIPLPRADGQLIGSDGVAYYIYLRSFVFDGDLDFTNDYRYFGLEAALDAPPTPTGKPSNLQAIGSAILWSPFFFVAHAIALTARAAGWPVQADGFGYLYQAAACIGSITYGFIGLWLAHRLARRYASAQASLAAAALVWFGSNALYYMVAEPSMAHMNSLFAVALLLTIWQRGRGSWAWRRWLLLGALVGLTALVRTQDALFGIAPLAEWLSGAWGQRRAWQKWGLAAIASIMGAAVVFAPQLAVWQHLYGSMTRSPYAYNHAFDWSSPHLLDTLFSLRHGLYLWHPLLLAATAGLVLLYRRDRLLALVFALMLLAQAYVIGTWDIWWLGDAFGGRGFIGCTTLFIVGLAVLGDALRGRLPAPLLWLGIIVALLWNGTFMVQYRFGFISMDEALTWQQLLWDKLTLPLEAWRRVGELAADGDLMKHT